MKKTENKNCENRGCATGSKTMSDSRLVNTIVRHTNIGDVVFFSGRDFDSGSLNPTPTRLPVSPAKRKKEDDSQTRTQMSFASIKPLHTSPLHLRCFHGERKFGDHFNLVLSRPE